MPLDKDENKETDTWITKELFTPTFILLLILVALVILAICLILYYIKKRNSSKPTSSTSKEVQTSLPSFSQNHSQIEQSSQKLNLQIHQIPTLKTHPADPIPPCILTMTAAPLPHDSSRQGQGGEMDQS